MSKPTVLSGLAGLSLILMASAFHMSVFAAVEANPYVNSPRGFSINAPIGWTVDSSGAYGTTVSFLGPTESSFRVNMNIVVESTSLTLAAYVSSAKTQLASALTSYTLVSEGALTIGGIGAYQLVATFVQGSFNLKNNQVFLVENQKAYVITSTALQTNYDTYSPAFSESVQTFKLVGAAFPWPVVIGIIVVVAGLGIGLTVVLKRRKPGVPVPAAVPETPTTAPPTQFSRA